MGVRASAWTLHELATFILNFDDHSRGRFAAPSLTPNRPMLRIFHRNISFSVAFAFLSILGAGAAATVHYATQDEVVRVARILILDRKYKDAAAALAADPGTGDEAATRRFLRGHALLLAGEGAEASAIFEQYLKDFPKGADAARARHGIAAAKRIQKDFAGAATLELTELQRLLSPERRMELAKVYLDYAEKAEKATNPNPQRARVFYDLAVSLELPAKDDERVRLKAAEMSELAQEGPDALARLREIQKTHGDGPGGMTKFKIATLQRLTGDMMGARRTYRDFLKSFPASEKAPDAAFGISLTFGMPAPPDDDSLAQGVAASLELIAKFPTHELARTAAFYIAAAEQVRGRLDEAVRDFQAFVSSAPKDDKDQRIAAARASIGSVLYQQAKYTEAIAAWKLYLAEHPSHGEFANVNRAIVDAEYAIAATAVRNALENAAAAREKGDAARAAIQTFLAGHPLDSRHPSAAMFLAAIEEMRERYDVAREEYERLASRYPNTTESSAAQFHVGRIYEEKTFDYEKAIESYKKVTGAYQDRANQRIAALLQKSLAVSTKRTIRTDETPSIEITSRNIEKLRLRAFRLDLDVFFRSKLALPRIESLDVEVIQADVRRDVATTPYVAHKQTTQSFTLNEFKGKPGAWVVKVDDGEFEATTLVLVSDLVFITKGTRDGLLVFAQNAITGAAAPDARIVVSDGKSILFEDKTGADGVYFNPRAFTAPAERIVVYGSSEFGAAVSGVELSSLTQTAAFQSRTLIVSDRASYRPGDTVHAWSIVRNVKENQYVVEPGREIKLSLAAPGGVVVRAITAQLSQFGTAIGHLELPSNAAYGQWTLMAQDPATRNVLGTRIVNVEEVRRDRMKLELNLEKAVAMRGDTIRGTVKARYFSGGPAAKRLIAILLESNDTVFVTTDDEGSAKFTFETRELSEEGTYGVVARMDDEGVFASTPLTVATVGFRPTIRSLQKVVLTNEPVDVAVSARDAGQNPYAAELQISVLKREARGARKVQSVNVSTDAKTGNATARITIAEGGIYALRVEGKDAFGSVVTAEASVTVSGDDDAEKLRIFIDKENWKLGETLKARVVSRLSAERSTLVTFDGNGILNYKIVRIPRGESSLELPIEEFLAPQATLSLASVDDWKLFSANRKISVSKGLTVTVQAPKNPVPPGGDVTVDVTVRDAKGKPVAAEILLSAVDAAFLAKRPDNNSKLTEFFYPTIREAGTAVSSSCGFTYSGETRRIASDLAADEERRRQNENKPAGPGGPASPAPSDFAAAGRPGLLRGQAGGTTGLAAASDPGSPAELSESLETITNASLISGGGQILGGKVPPVPFSVQFVDGRGALHPVAGDSVSYAEKEKNVRSDTLRRKAGAKDRNSDKKDASRAAKKLQTTPRAGGGGGEMHDSLGAEWKSDRDEDGILADDTSEFSNEGAEVENAIRRELSENACFEIVSTTPDGVGKLTFKARESTTEWLISARGVSKITEVGEASGTFVTHRDLEISLRLPSVAVEGDRLDSAFVVRNTTDKTQKIEAELTLVGAEGSGKVAMELKGGEESAASRPITIGRENSVKLTATAKSDSAQDGLERTLEILPAGSEYVDHAQTVVREKSKLELELRDFAKLRNSKLEIFLSPGFDNDILEDQAPVFRMAGSSEAFHDSPGWAITRGEVALDRMSYIARVGLKDEAAIARNRQRVADAVARISSDVGADGAINWAGNQSIQVISKSAALADPANGARALAFLANARRAGFEVSEEVVQRITQWIRERMRNEESLPARARLVYALAEAGVQDAEVLQRLQRSRAELPDTALGLLGLADLRIGRRDLAMEVADTLRKRASNEAGALPFGNAKIAGTDALEASGIALALLSECARDDSFTRTLADSVRVHRRRIATDRGEAAAMRGLVAWFQNIKVDRAEFSLKIALNGEDFKTIKSSELRGEMTIVVPTEKIRAKNSIDFTITGRGEVAAIAVFSGIGNGYRKPENRYAYFNRTVSPAQIVYRGQKIQRGYGVIDGNVVTIQNEVKNLAAGVEALVAISFSKRENQEGKLDYSILEEAIPAGCEVVPNSIFGSFERVTIRNGKIIAAFPNNNSYGNISYTLLGVRTGQYTFAPAVVRSVYRPEQFAETEDRKLVILPLGTPSPDEFKRTPDEYYYEGIARFDAGQHVEGAALLRTLCAEYRLRADFLKEATRRILLDAIERKDFAETIKAFERLRDRFADLSLPFETILQVGSAYLSMQQSEIADIIFRGTAGALYRREANVAGALLRENEFMAAVKFLSELHATYPDLQETIVAIHEVAGLVASTAAEPQKLSKSLTREQLLTLACELELEFLTRAPESPLAAEAAFGFLSAELSRERFKQVIEGCAAFTRRYPDSNLIDEVLYLEGYARFANGDAKTALDVLQRVISEQFTDPNGMKGVSGYKDRAVLLRAQILHATGDIRGAVAEYEKVRAAFTDASDAVQNFKNQSLDLPSVKVLGMKDPGEFIVKSKNLVRANMRVYRVDLMRLYLMEKNLDRMTGIDLSGIAPLLVRDIELGTAEDYEEKETTVKLELPEKGAYLVVLRSSGTAGAQTLAAATLLLRTDLKLEVREDVDAGRIWVNVRDARNSSVPKAEVRVVGTRNGNVTVGTTDLRGVYIADGIHGRATVVAQVPPASPDDKSGPSFAFYRGNSDLVPQNTKPGKSKRPAGPEQNSNFDAQALDELFKQNANIQLQNRTQLENKLNYRQTGVELDRVK